MVPFNSASFSSFLSEVEEVIPVAHENYESQLKPDSMVTVYLKGTVQDTKRSYAHIDTFGLLKPNLTVQVSAGNTTGPFGNTVACGPQSIIPSTSAGQVTIV